MQVDPNSMKHLPDDVQEAWHTLWFYLAQAERDLLTSALHAEGEAYYQAQRRVNRYSELLISTRADLAQALDQSFMIP